MKELGSLHDLKAWNPLPLDPEKHTHQQRVNALLTVVFLKEKRDGTLKTRACVNGASQQKLWKKEDASSPTLHLESVILSAEIAAWERRKVRCFHIPSTFSKADITDEEVIMVLKGDLADLLIMLAPPMYGPFATNDTRGRMLLYVCLQKVVYGLMGAALLFYRNFRSELEAYGFVMNPYDPCVASLTTPEGNQFNVCLLHGGLRIDEVCSVLGKNIRPETHHAHGQQI